MRISDWSSDVCSSDLILHEDGQGLKYLDIVEVRLVEQRPGVVKERFRMPVHFPEFRAPNPRKCLAGRTSYNHVDSFFYRAKPQVSAKIRRFSRCDVVWSGMTLIKRVKVDPVRLCRKRIEFQRQHNLKASGTQHHKK